MIERVRGARGELKPLEIRPLFGEPTTIKRSNNNRESAKNNNGKKEWGHT